MNELVAGWARDPLKQMAFGLLNAQLNPLPERFWQRLGKRVVGTAPAGR